MIQVQAGALMMAVLEVACLQSPPRTQIDGDSGLPSPDAARICTSYGPWEAPVVVPELTGVDAVSPTVSGDGNLLVWETPAGDLGAAVRTAAEFEPAPAGLLQAINVIGGNRNPSLSSDGLTLWFTRGGQGLAILMISRREEPGANFPSPETVQGLETLGVEGPDVWEDGHTIVFSVTDGSQFDLASATCEDWRSCAYSGLIGELVMGLDDMFPTVRTDGLELIYNYASSNSLVAAIRLSSDGPFDIYDELGFEGFDPELTSEATTLYLARDTRLYRAERACVE